MNVKNIKTNTLYVSCGTNDQMFSSGCVVTDFNWITEKENGIFDCFVKLRYRQPDQKTKIEVVNDKTIKLTFEEKQRAVTTGQFAVLYREDGTCVGGGMINEIIK